MKYKKIINMLDDTTDQSTKFKTRKLVEINDESRVNYDKSNIKFKRSKWYGKYLCDYGDAWMLFKGTITIPNTKAAGWAVNNTNKKVIIKYCAPFTNCLTEINNT